ncbi:hypothetical protein X801_02886 [Opisthorchis viverrini]|uniref:Thrombospondin type 3 repeat-containing domain protein n=1 Tax=Opisthorchis viverrini TaxID=6198 RepID=A0A1S8X3B6_OPIVI|nr:hypothetical protein X801_02886 [Opisthorchis viverrini]
MNFHVVSFCAILKCVAELARNQANLLNVDLGDPNDKDCDGIPDHLDNDQDNDGKIDRTQDSDMDGILNHVDEDDDNDDFLRKTSHSRPIGPDKLMVVRNSKCPL